MTPDDLLAVRRFAKYQAAKYGREALENDFVSDACLRLIRVEIPNESEHRRRFIRMVVSRAAVDFMRRDSITPRRVIQKMKKGLPLSMREQLKVGSVQAFDFNQDWLKEVAEVLSTPDLPDVRRALSCIGFDHPVEFFVLTMSFIHEMLLKDIGELIGVTEARVCQIQQKGLEFVRRELKKIEAP